MNYRIVSEAGVQYLVRGGGGGSSSSGGGGSSSSGGFSSGSRYSSSSSSGSTGSDGFSWVFFLVFIIVVVVVFIITKTIKPQGLGSSISVPPGFIDPEANKNSNEEEKKLALEAKRVFLEFQQAWANFDLKSMSSLVSAEYFKKMTLELNVLKNYERQNLMKDVAISGAYIKQTKDYKDGFLVFFTASAEDRLVDLREKKDLYIDHATFSEIWHFIKQGKGYVLDQIYQTTADTSKFDKNIESFADKNKFYYDPDFGWLMMPTRGAIFGPAGFGRADINNHVIGAYKDKIVEFYSYEPQAGMGMEPITVAQAILPKRYDDILVTEKSWYNFKPKQKDLERVETESNDFNKKFAIWAAKPDRATSFELLTTNFMEKIYSLDFEVNIEVVDNVLYLYSPGINLNYQTMLEVLSWAFDEMKL